MWNLTHNYTNSYLIIPSQPYYFPLSFPEDPEFPRNVQEPINYYLPLSTTTPFHQVAVTLLTDPLSWSFNDDNSNITINTWDHYYPGFHQLDSVTIEKPLLDTGIYNNQQTSWSKTQKRCPKVRQSDNWCDKRSDEYATIHGHDGCLPGVIRGVMSRLLHTRGCVYILPIVTVYGVCEGMRR